MLKAFQIITPSWWPVLSKDPLNSLREYSRVAVWDEHHTGYANTDMTYAFSGEAKTPTHPESHANSGIRTWDLVTARQRPKPLHHCDHSANMHPPSANRESVNISLPGNLHCLTAIEDDSDQYITSSLTYLAPVGYGLPPMDTANSEGIHLYLINCSLVYIENHFDLKRAHSSCMEIDCITIHPSVGNPIT
jgi:hypothetical protein